MNCNISLLAIPLQVSSKNNTISVYKNVSTFIIETNFTESINPYSEQAVVYKWSCLNCQVEAFISNNTKNAVINVEIMPLGTYNLTLSAHVVFVEGNVTFTRYSGIIEIQLMVKEVPEEYTVNIVGVPEVLTTSKLSAITATLPSVSMNQTLLSKFLGCSSKSQCGSVSLEYKITLLFTNDTASTTLVESNGFTLGSTNNQMNTLTLSPVVSFTFDSSLSKSYSNGSTISQFEIIVSVTNKANNRNFTTTQTIPIVSPIYPPSNVQTTELVTVTPSSGVAMRNRFNITMEQWIAADALKPLQYAVGFYDTTKSSVVRLSPFTYNTTTFLYLPYTAVSSSRRLVTARSVQIVVFVMDKYGNVDWKASETVTVSPFDGNSTELLTLMNTFSSTDLSVLSYDTSLLASGDNSTDVKIKLIENIEFDTKNPSVALNSLLSLSADTSSVSAEMVDLINNKVSAFLNNVTSTYQEEKKQYSYVKNIILSNDDTQSTFSLLSNLLSTGLGMESTDDNTERTISLTLMAQVPTQLTTTLPILQFATSSINVTLSSFSIDQTNPPVQTQSLSTGKNSANLDLASISKQISSDSTLVMSISFVSLLKNTRSDNYTKLYPVVAPVTEFTLRKDDSILPLIDLTSIINLNFTFNRVFYENIMNATNSSASLECKYWNETEGQWKGNGCSLSNLNGEIVTCSCNHTTKFATFLQYNLTQIISSKYKTEVAGVYIGEIVFGVIYGTISLVILILLIVFRNHQPVKSRLSTPYLGMLALLVESVLISIIQKGLLVDQLQNNKLQSNAYEKDVENVVNWFGGIASIVVNTLNLVAILSFLMQVARYQCMKHLYNLMTLLHKNSKSSGDTVSFYSKKVNQIKKLTSPLIFNTTLVIFAIVNILYWTLWFILKYTGQIPANTYTYIMSISYCVTILTFGVLICLLTVVDIILTYKFTKREHEESISKKLLPNKTTTNPNTIATPSKPTSLSEKKEAIILSDLLEELWRWFIKQDTPLFFRMEMVFFIISFIFLIVAQALGLSTLDSRYGSDSMFRLALISDSARFAIELAYTLFYCLVFGGFAVLVAIRNLYRKKMKASSQPQKSEAETKLDNEIETEEMSAVLSDPEGLMVLEAFCLKEFSIENLYVFLDVRAFQLSLKEKMEDSEKFLKELHEFCVAVYEAYLRENATLEVNIPARTRNSFFILFKMVVETAKNQPFYDHKYEEIIYKELTKKKLVTQATSMKPQKTDASVMELIDEQQKPTTVKRSIMWNGYENMITSCMDSFYHQVVMNLGDTFSRLVFTPEYKAFETTKQLKNDILNRDGFTL